jgi:hypothetical protein
VPGEDHVCTVTHVAEVASCICGGHKVITTFDSLKFSNIFVACYFILRFHGVFNKGCLFTHHYVISSHCLS